MGRVRRLYTRLAAVRICNMSALHVTASAIAPRHVDRFGFFLENGTAAPLLLADERRLDYSRTKKWLAMLDDWEPYVRTHPNQLKRRIRKGVPNSLRSRVWPLLCGASSLKASSPLLYQQMLHKTPARADLTSIALDLPRTYPHHVLFSSSGAAVHTSAQSLPTDASMSRGQKGLRDVLRAYACYDPRVGYCQGMAFVAGLLLSYMPAEDTFFLIVALMQDPLYGLSRMYAPALHQFHEVMHVFGELVEMHLPRLAAHLANLGVEYVTFSSQWFITLYTSVSLFSPSRLCRTRMHPFHPHSCPPSPIQLFFSFRFCDKSLGLVPFGRLESDVSCRCCLS